MKPIKNYFFCLALLLAMAISTNIFSENSSPEISNIVATSTLEPRTLKYNPFNLTDGSEQSWCEGKRGDGIGENIYFDLKYQSAGQKNVPKFFFIKNGFGDPKYYKKNNRVKSLLIYSVPGHSKTSVLLKDTPEYQKIEVPKYTQDRFYIEIDSVYKGSKYDDTCITEIAFSQPKLSKKQKNSPLTDSLSFLIDHCTYYLYSKGKVESGQDSNTGCWHKFIKGSWYKNQSGKYVILKYAGIEGEGGGYYFESFILDSKQSEKLEGFFK